MNRGYKVIISTHSSVMLEFAWAVDILKENKATDKSLADLFDMTPVSKPLKEMFTNILKNKTIKTYYFDRKDNSVSVKDISSLDAGSDDVSISEWGGLSSFISKATEIVLQFTANEA